LVQAGFNEYNNDYVKMSVVVPSGKIVSGFAFDHSDAENYSISMAPEKVVPDVFMYEPSVIDSRVKRCAFVATSEVKENIEIIFKYTATGKEGLDTREYTGPAIQGLSITDFILYDANRQDLLYEVNDNLEENQTVYGDQGSAF
jgi:hypothetical protein